MAPEIIGHGTWYDKTALKIIEREEKLGRSLDLVRTEMGISVSGIPHVGNLSDATRAYAVTVALQSQGYNSEMIAFSDDKDGLRKVPAGLPSWLQKYLGHPVRNIPDPFGKCHSSFAEHVNALILEAIEKCGIQYKYMSATDVYERGLLNKEIETILMNTQKVSEIIKGEVGQEKFEQTLPYFAICSNCGRIYTTKTYEFLPKERKVLYKCEGMEIKRQWFQGCGHQGEVDYTKAEGKLAWKVEFAARWKALNIRFEAYGKEIADSVRVNDRISQEILNYAAPYHAKYELFLDKSGKRISKSAGNVFTPQVWLRYGSPQSLVLLMLKRFVGTRELSVVDIPQYMNELDELEDIYFDKKKIADKKGLSKLKGLYEYVWWLKAPKQPSIHVPYNLLTYLAKVAPKDSEIKYIEQKLREYGYIRDKELTLNLKERIGYALNWNRDFMEIKETTIKLTVGEAEALKKIIQILQTEADVNAEKIQSEIFASARKNNVAPNQFFRILYTTLLGAPAGPRLGPYIISMGRQNVIDALKRALEKNNH
jgi:lysyl-tRNA synthetase class 1